MSQQLFRWLTLVHRFLEAAIDEILSIIANRNLSIEFVLFISYDIEKASNSCTIVFSWIVRPLVIKQVISYYSQGPDITLLSILVPSKNFRSHRHRRANKTFQPAIREILRKAKVSQLQLVISTDEYICWLKISMGDLLFAEIRFLRVHFH